MARLTLKPADLSVVPGPAFEAQGEDGPYTDWRVFVVYRPQAGEGMHPLTWERSFGRRGEREAQGWVDRMVEHGSIDACKWVDGDPWQPYHDGLSLQERLSPFGPEWAREERKARGH
jgi:hypothetical protein